MEEEVKREIPKEVKILSILFFIFALISLVIGIIFLFILVSTISSTEFFPAFSMRILILFFGIFIFIRGILQIPFSILAFFTGMGLWKGKNWARISAIILIPIGIFLFFVGSLISENQTMFGVIGNVMGIISFIILIIYLLFNKKIKEAFN